MFGEKHKRTGAQKRLCFLLAASRPIISLFFLKMKKHLSLLFLLVCGSLIAQKPAKPSYRFDVDLNAVEDDLLTVTLEVPKLDRGSLTYHLPKMVPGTYKIYDFGRFVKDFKALDASGNELATDKPDPNSWVIADGAKLAKLVYKVEDTWDTELDNQVFEPAGTNFESENYVFNNHGIFGFFEGFEKLPYYVTVARPESMFGSTSLQRIGGSSNSDVFFAETYNYLVDGPIMFCRPDTTWLQVANARVLVSVYSPNGLVTSKYIATEIGPTLEAQRVYLGGELPVDHYAFLLYLNDENYSSGSAGALEHSYSSFYALFEGEPDAIAETVRDVSAHEFFHIVTPLNIHSEEIQDFDFIDPKMSRHLWLYEGYTEYSSHIAQVRGRLTTMEHFLGKMREKMEVSENFKQDLPFTELSLGALDKYEDQYVNVYQKGALIGMFLDIKLRQLSKGKYGMADLMRDLSKKYGKERAFKDEELFGEITKLTFPEVGDFLNRFVGGAEPLPYAELLRLAGIEYLPKGKTKELSPLGGIENPGALGFDFAEMRLKIEKVENLDKFGQKKFKFKKGDVITEWNGQDLTFATVNAVLGVYMATAKEGDEVTVKVLRKGKTVVLKTKLQKMTVEAKHILRPMAKATPEQLALRKAWLGDCRAE
jgi:predicted metalloprotease with PDZ domain